MGTVRADGLGPDVASPRAIGRAGTVTVSGDGLSALLVNPAGLARRGESRGQLGVIVTDDDSRFTAPDAAATNSPTIADRASPQASPTIAAHRAVGDFVFGIALIESAHLDRGTPVPEPGQPAADVERLFPHRYGGLALGYRRRALMVGFAARVTEWLGLGLSIGAADVEVAERRRIWAGFAGRDPIGSPTRDLDLVLTARDRFVPMASAGALIAPLDWPIELAASVSYSADAHPNGSIDLTRASESSFPAVQENSESEAELRLGSPSAARIGVRYLGERLSIEVGGDVHWLPEAGRTPTWRVRGISVEDETGQTAAVDRVPSLIAQTPRITGRTAADWSLVPGLLWLSTGYAYSTASTGDEHLSPVYGISDSHTVALGAEAIWDGITLSLGYARTIVPSVTVTEDDTEVLLINPFEAGTGPAGAGRHSRSRDTVGLSFEVAWP